MNPVSPAIRDATRQMLFDGVDTRIIISVFGITIETLRARCKKWGLPTRLVPRLRK